MARSSGVQGLVDQPLKELGEIYESSLKQFLECGLEFYLSMSLVLSFFECPDTSVQDEQELQTLYTMSWMPLLSAALLVYGARISRRLGPAPENFDRNMLRLKVATWIYSFLFLIWDDDMVIKTGPSLGVSILFCVCDIARFLMEMHRLLDIEEDENGNSIIVTDARELPQSQSQSTPETEANYSVTRVGTSNATGAHETAQKTPNGDHTANTNPQSPVRPVEPTQQSWRRPQPPTQPPPASQPSLPMYGGTNKPASRRQLLKQERKARRAGGEHYVGEDKSPSQLQSEYVAVLDPNARSVDKEAAQLFAKKSFTYEF